MALPTIQKVVKSAKRKVPANKQSTLEM